MALDNSFEMVFVQGRTLAGVHDATSLDAALDLAAKVRPRLKGKAVNNPTDRKRSTRQPAR